MIKGLLGCGFVLFFVLVALSLGFLLTCLVAKLILFVAVAVFGCDLTSKYWGIVALLYLISIVKGFVLSVNVSK